MAQIPCDDESNRSGNKLSGKMWSKFCISYVMNFLLSPEFRFALCVFNLAIELWVCVCLCTTLKVHCIVADPMWWAKIVCTHPIVYFFLSSSSSFSCSSSSHFSSFLFISFLLFSFYILIFRINFFSLYLISCLKTFQSFIHNAHTSKPLHQPIDSFLKYIF